MRICQPPGERLTRLAEVLGHESEAAKHRRDLQIDAVAFEPPEALLQVAVARQHRLVLRFRHGVVAEPLLERLDLGAHVEKGFEGEAGLFDQGAAAVVQSVLRQVSNGKA